ncbi:MAG TPA: helix-turn-helix domain-containing protein [Vineibacter sp.]|nr:helix-turn-helix domain-containing protein [Vineibacter sp.]
MRSPVIEPVRRAFLVLEALNRRRSTTLSALAAETGLPRPTVVRLLQTLVALGYAAQVSRQSGYRLTDQVLSLAGGVRFNDRLIDAAIPHMSRFTRTYGWPLYLATLSRGAITVRHSTATESPMSFEAAGFNSRQPVLVSALGRAWLAFCPDDERRTILREIGVRLTPTLAAALGEIRRDGFAFTRLARPSRLHGMAVAVRRDGRVLGTISMRFPRSALSEAEAGANFATPLTLLARAIADDIDAEGSAAPSPTAIVSRQP